MVETIKVQFGLSMPVIHIWPIFVRLGSFRVVWTITVQFAVFHESAVRENGFKGEVPTILHTSMPYLV